MSQQTKLSYTIEFFIPIILKVLAIDTILKVGKPTWSCTATTAARKTASGLKENE